MTTVAKAKTPKQVFDYVVLDTESDKIVKEGRVLSEDSKKATLKIASELSSELSERIDDLEVLVRPF